MHGEPTDDLDRPESQENLGSDKPDSTNTALTGGPASADRDSIEYPLPTAPAAAGRPEPEPDLDTADMTASPGADHSDLDLNEQTGETETVDSVDEETDSAEEDENSDVADTEEDEDTGEDNDDGDTNDDDGGGTASQTDFSSAPSSPDGVHSPADFEHMGPHEQAYFRRWQAAQLKLQAGNPPPNPPTSSQTTSKPDSDRPDIGDPDIDGPDIGGQDTWTSEASWDEDEFDPDEFDWTPIGANRDIYQPPAKPGLQYEPLDEEAWEAANQPQLSHADWYRLAGHQDQLIRCTVAARADCPTEVLESLRADPSQTVRWALLRNPSCPPDILEVAPQSGSPVQLIMAVTNPACPASAMATAVAGKPQPEVLCAILCREDSSRDARHAALEQLGSRYKIQLALQTGLPSDTYNALMSDPEARPVVLANPDCPRYLLAFGQLAPDTVTT